MWQKIKSVLLVFVRGAFSSWKGFLGAVMIVASIYLFTGLFTGIASVQNYIKNARALNKADDKIAAIRSELETTNRHIKLLLDHSPDFVSEMAVKYLNLGDPNAKVIKK